MKKRKEKRSRKKEEETVKFENVTRNVRQARLPLDDGLYPTPLLLVHPSFTFVLCCTWGARAALASTISLTGYAPHAVRRVVQHPAFWFLARSKRGLSRLTNRAFRAREGEGGEGILTSWYSLNCILVHTSIWCGGPARRPWRKPFYHEIVFRNCRNCRT